jgi:NhaA family Na+:H+ antiporter
LFLVEMALAGQPSAANVAKLAVLASSTVAATVGAALMAKLPDSSIEAEKLKTA